MATIAKLSVLLGLNNQPFASGISQSSKMADSFGASIVSKMGVAAAGFFAVSKAIDFMADSFAEANEAAKAESRLGAVLDATGGAAGFSAKQIGDYANQLGQMASIEDEAIVNGAAMLASFKNIRGDAFTGAMEAAVDLAAVTDGDVTSSMEKLGRALTDPAEGLGMLKKANVTFTDEQERMIKKLQESGDLLGAQAIILGEVESRFGGAAAKMAQPVDKLATSWANFKQTIGESAIGESWNLLLEEMAFHVNTLNDAIKETPEPIAPLPSGGGGDVLPSGPSEEGLKLLEQYNKEIEMQIGTWRATTAEANRYRLEVEGVSSEEIARLEKRQEAFKNLETEGEFLDLQADLQKQIATFGMSASAVKIYELATEGATDAQLEQVRVLGQQLDAMEAQKKAAEKAADATKKASEEQKRMVEETLRAAQPLREQAEELLQAGSLFDKGLIDQGQFDDFIAQFQKDFIADLPDIPEVKFGGAALAGSQEDIGIRNKFLAESGRQDEQKALMKQQVAKLQQIVDELKEQNAKEPEVVDSF